MIISKIKEWCSANRKSIFYTLLFGFLFFSLGDSAFAEGDELTKSANTGIEIMNNLVLIVSTIIAILTSLVSLLLHPGWVNGTIFGFDTHLKEIWILISNIVYFIFAFILIGIAFMNIIGKGQDKWELKSALPRFVIGVLIVPFSWFFVQFILALSAFLTVSVLTIPYDTLEGKSAFTAVSEKEICTKYYINLNNTESKKSFLDQVMAQDCEKKKIQKILSGEGSEGISGSIFGMINIYTYGIMSIDQLDELKQMTIESAIKDILSLSVKVLIDLLFIVVFLILMIALFMALFARGTWLWIHVMFSPFYGLMYFLGKDAGGEEVKKVSITEFLALAMVPVYVSAALAFGLMFMFVAADGLSKETTTQENIFKAEEATGKPMVSIGGFSLVIDGAANTAKEDKENLFSSVFQGAGNALGSIILQLFGLAILWIAVMAALKQSSITKNITEPIAGFGDSVGKLIAKSPTYAPIIPTGKGMVSAVGLQKVGGTLSGAMDMKVTNRTKGLQGLVNSTFGVQITDRGLLAKTKADWLDNVDPREFSGINKTYLNELRKTGTSDPELVKDIKGYIGQLLRQDIPQIKSEIGDLKPEDYFKNGQIDNKVLKILMAEDYVGISSVLYSKVVDEKGAINRRDGYKTPADGSTKESSTSNGADTEANRLNNKINVDSLTKNDIKVDGDIVKIGNEEIDITGIDDAKKLNITEELKTLKDKDATSGNDFKNFINVVEKATNKDLDGDGDTGVK